MLLLAARQGTRRRCGGKGKKICPRTQEAMDFNPKPRVLYDQEEVDEYLVMYDVRFPSNVEVEWCSLETNVTVSPPAGSVYFHPQILALGVKLPMTLFVRGVLAYFKVPPSQLTPRAWRTVLGFKERVPLMPMLHTVWRKSVPLM